MNTHFLVARLTPSLTYVLKLFNTNYCYAPSAENATDLSKKLMNRKALKGGGGKLWGLYKTAKSMLLFSKYRYRGKNLEKTFRLRYTRY